MVGEFSRRGVSKFYSCRYGNVVGSTGSVIPLFERQLREKGQVTITDPDMTRYWISVNQAVDLIKNTLEWCEPGSVLIPEPASMKLLDLAKLLTHYDERQIEIIGPRPGEKRHEQLMHQQESVRARNIGGFYELYSSLHEPVSEPFALTSDAPRVWCSNEFMLSSIEDAKLV
jgi:UDP-N-acetylglucosamine 4,6-dehydratase